MRGPGVALQAGDVLASYRIVSGLARLFLKYDIADLDITSLVKLGEGEFVALDVEADLETSPQAQARPVPVVPDQSCER